MRSQVVLIWHRGCSHVGITRPQRSPCPWSCVRKAPSQCPDDVSAHADDQVGEGAPAELAAFLRGAVDGRPDSARAHPEPAMNLPCRTERADPRTRRACPGHRGRPGRNCARPEASARLDRAAGTRRTAMARGSGDGPPPTPGPRTPPRPAASRSSRTRSRAGRAPRCRTADRRVSDPCARIHAWVQVCPPALSEATAAADRTGAACPVPQTPLCRRTTQVRRPRTDEHPSAVPGAASRLTILVEIVGPAGGAHGCSVASSPRWSAAVLTAPKSKSSRRLLLPVPDGLTTREPGMNSTGEVIAH